MNDRMRKLHEGGIWVTAEHKEIPVPKMTSSHLRNAILLLGRRATRATEGMSKPVGYRSIWSYPEPHGEMAQVAYDQACMQEDDIFFGPEDVSLSALAQQPIFIHLITEAHRRGLEITVCNKSIRDLYVGIINGELENPDGQIVNW